MTAAPSLLAGLRILDLADRSGALAGKLLAGLGADVVLAEPAGGSPLRTIPPFWQGAPDPERSLFFWFYAAGKRSVRAPPARLARRVAAADVVLETGPPGGWRAWRDAHPRLVVASITPFGQAGPYAGWQASDLVAQAMGGMLAVSGHPGEPPQQALGLQAYHQAGVLAAVGVVSALLARDTTRRGQHVDVSLQAAVAGSLEHVPGFFHQDGRVAARQGTLHWTRYFRVGRCRDGWVMHCTLGDWTTLREWVKADGAAPPELDDPALDEPRSRQARAEWLFDVLDAWAERYAVDEIYERAQLLRLPYAAVRAPEALLRDPHLAARGFFVPIEHPDLPATLAYPGAPFRAGALAWRIARPPRLGEHDAEVDAEWS
jgi:benzylsuccinate CoA-transferase BbsE subunit